MSENRMSKRRLLAAVAGVGLVAAGLPAAAGATSEADVEVEETSKVTSEVSSALEAGGTSNVWIQLSSTPDLSQAAGLSWEERGQYVYDALRANAEESQAGLLADLDAQGADYEAYWINNAVFVRGADADLVSQAAASGAVKAVTADFEPELIEPDLDTSGSSPLAITNWGLESIKAPTIWEEYDQRGEGIVLGTFDTGVEADHPALVEQYRGTETGSDDYNWFDSRPEDERSDTPTDPNGHGTHVTGTMVGDDGGENQIGVAPEAQFIGGVACCVGSNDLVASMQWFLAPTPVGSDEGDPDQRPQIINNSWGFPGVQAPRDDPDYGIVFDGVEAWSDAGIFNVWAAGNSGEGACDTVSSPAWNDVAGYVVGNHQEDGGIYDDPDFGSSRGPGEDGEPGVDIGAPGTEIVSSVPGGGYQPATGTSMAAPHVAGSVALLWAEFPDLQGDIPATQALLDEAAIDTEDPSCGGPVENNETWGEGRLDLVALFEAAGGDDPEPPTSVVERWGGDDRYDTAALISEAYPDGVDTVYVATGQDYADATAAAPSAAKGVVAGFGTLETPDGDAAPVLLTKPDEIPSDTAAALEALGASNVVVLGGDTRISADVADALGEYGDVSRIEGTDRYDTAANLALEWGSAETVVVASGEPGAYPDALTGGAWAAWNDAPILLTKKGEVPSDTAAALEELAPSQVVVLGGTDAVDADTYTELGGSLRVEGEDRYETAVAISGELEPGVDVVYVAFGEDYPDALAGSALAGAQDAAVLLTRGNKLSNATAAELVRLDPASVVVLGGEEAIDADTYGAIEELFASE